jgi:tetratricopeptide (TPR) repeat protein
MIGKDRILTLRARQAWNTVPGEIVAVEPAKYWLYGGNPYLSGEIVSTRLDAVALGLVPLKLKPWGMWDPQDEYWGEEEDPVEDWARPIIARGKRPIFEMEQVIPGADPQGDSDPILDAVDLKNAGDYQRALKLLMELCEADLRCIDAHAHLGLFVFDGAPGTAIRHYEVGMRIGKLSLPAGFDGLLPWPNIDNRPFLRCMHGYGLSLWRLKRFKEAAKIFERMLWLNPSDNQGIRFLIDDVKKRKTWHEDAYQG